VLSIICAPASAPQQYVPPPQPPTTPKLDLIDRRIIEAVREHGPVKLWSLLNWLAQDEGERSRTDGRVARLNLWDRVRRLKRLKVIFGVGRNEVAATKRSRQPARPRPRRRKRSVVSAPEFCGVSATCAPPMQTLTDFNEPPETQMVRVTTPKGANAQEPQETNTVPDAAQVAEAARSLASLPRRPRRRWSGMIGSVRSYRNMPIRLPDQRVVFALGAKHGRVPYTSQPDGPIGSVEGIWRDWGVVPAHLVEVVRNPAAMLLGGLKRGTKEAPSPRKQMAARLNGCRPVRAGSRPRGRPRAT
jgi:DNA-binding Lrp family transcriptional regulator